MKRIARGIVWWIDHWKQVKEVLTGKLVLALFVVSGFAHWWLPFAIMGAFLLGMALLAAVLFGDPALIAWARRTAPDRPTGGRMTERDELVAAWDRANAALRATAECDRGNAEWHRACAEQDRAYNALREYDRAALPSPSPEAL